MKIRCSVSTYLLLKVSMSSPAARIAKDFTHRRKLPCGSFETDPTKKPEFRDNHASLTVAKYSSLFYQIQAINIKSLTEHLQVFSYQHHVLYLLLLLKLGALPDRQYM